MADEPKDLKGLSYEDAIIKLHNELVGANTRIKSLEERANIKHNDAAHNDKVHQNFMKRIVDLENKVVGLEEKKLSFDIGDDAHIEGLYNKVHALEEKVKELEKKLIDFKDATETMLNSVEFTAHIIKSIKDLQMDPDTFKKGDK